MGCRELIKFYTAWLSLGTILFGAAVIYIYGALLSLLYIIGRIFK